LIDQIEEEMEYEFKNLSISELYKRINFITEKYEKDIKELKRQFQLDCDPLKKLYDKKIKLEEINEQLIDSGYVEEEEAKPLKKKMKIEKSIQNRDFFKQYSSPSNPPIRSKKKSSSPMKIASKTENGFFKKSTFIW
jgi:hypothetical protein